MISISLEKEILTLIELNELSKLREILYISLNKQYNINLLKLLSLIEGALGNFQTSLDIFLNNPQLKEEIKEFYLFLIKDIKNEYIPKFNKLIKLIKTKEKGIEELLISLEKIFPNVDLYYVITLYYIDIQNFKKANFYLNKGLDIDKSNLLFFQLKDNILKDNYINKHNKIKKYIPVLSVLILFGLIGYSIKNNYSLNLLEKNNQIISLKNQQKMSIKTTKENTSNFIKKLENKNLYILNLNKTINNLKNLNKQQQVQILESNLFESGYTSKELFLKGLKLRKEKKYNIAIECFKMSIQKSENSIYKRESIFWLAKTYENINKQIKAIEYYKLYLNLYPKINIYKKDIQNSLNQLTLKESL